MRVDAFINAGATGGGGLLVLCYSELILSYAYYLWWSVCIN